MQKNKNLNIFNFSLSLTAFALITLLFIFNIYYLLKIFGVEAFLNTVNKEIYVPWLYKAIYPKNYFKLFYNFSIIFLPLSSILLTIKIGHFIKKAHVFFIGVLTGFVAFMPLFYLQSHKTLTKLVIADIVFISLTVVVSLFFQPIRTALSNIHIKKYSWSTKKLAYHDKSLTKFIQKNHFWILLTLLFIVLINFAYLLETGIWINYYHHNYFIATINDLIQGKHILVDTFNQYGLLWPLLFYFLFTTIIPFSYMNLYLLLMIFTYIYYVILYFFIKKLTKNPVITLIGIYVILGVNTLFNYPVFPFSENYVWPGSTPLRFFFDSAVFLIVLGNPYFKSYGLTILSGFLTAYSLFHNFEMGVSLASAYIFLLLTNAFFIKKRLLPFSVFFISLVLIFLAFVAYTFIASGQLPDWELYWRFISLYQAGFTNSATPLVGWYYLHLLIYFSVLISTLYLQIRKKVNWKWTVLGAYSLYGLLILNYYLSRSHYSNLTVVSIPALVIFITLFSDLKKIKNIFTPKVFQLVYSLFVAVFIVLSVFTSFYLYKRINYRVWSWKEVQKLKKYPNNRAFIVANYVPVEDYTAEDIISSVDKIKELTKDEKKILLISKYDAVIFIMAEKTNIISYPLLEQIHTIENKKKVKKDLVQMKDKPRYLFIDKINSGEKKSDLPEPRDVLDEIQNSITPYYEYKKQVGILDIYELINRN